MLLEHIRPLANKLIFSRLPKTPPEPGEVKVYELDQEVRRRLIHGDVEESKEAYLELREKEEKDGRVYLSQEALEFVSDMRGHLQIFKEQTSKD